MPKPSRNAPLVIIGTGIAGLFVALEAEERGIHPLLLTKSSLKESNTLYAQGGIAAAIGAKDSPRLHFEDTVRAGAGLVDRRAAWILAQEAPNRISDLVHLGVPFDTVDGQITLGREAAHSLPRVVHSGGDATGRQIEETLQRRVRERAIEVWEGFTVNSLSVSGNHVRGVLGRGRRGEVRIETDRVVLATGGGGHLFRESSNPSIATGEGVAMALNAGARVRDMEFMQFHPTVFYGEGKPRFLLTEALRGEGALLRDSHGDTFMRQYHPLAELAPRDVVSRAIVTQMERLGDSVVFLDATGIRSERLRVRFPTVYKFLEGVGLHLDRDLIPVTPVAHYMVGGVSTDMDGKTNVRGLYACGEVASTGVHGANRLASNSLMEGLVFGTRLVRSLGREGTWRREPGSIPTHSIPVTRRARSAGDPPLPPMNKADIGEVLWKNVGIVRDRAPLMEAVRRFSAEWRERRDDRGSGWPTPMENHALTALLMAWGALVRQESRGGHFRRDFPHRVGRWRVHVEFRSKS